MNRASTTALTGAHEQAITKKNETSRPIASTAMAKGLSSWKATERVAPRQKKSERLDHAKAHGFYADVESQ